ncbi:MAG: beta-galactosidase [Labilibaculum sp.]|nr:beta-galactosidase [Labilibaculum sp.]MBI9057331.1 beta-galactosidase [Labilibaculum sp.]
MNRTIIFTILTIAIGTLFTKSNLYASQNLQSKSIAIFDTQSEIAKSLGEDFINKGFSVEFLDVEQVIKSEILNTDKYFLYVLPPIETYPIEGNTALISFLEQKGNLMILGTPEFNGDLLLETISPRYKMYPMHNIAKINIVKEQEVFKNKDVVLPVAKEVSSCFQRPTGKGFQCGYRFRWIPLLSAHDETGFKRGTPAWMLINNPPIEQDEFFQDALRRIVATTQGNKAKEQLNLEGSVFAACAIDDEKTLETFVQSGLFSNMAKRISQGLYLYHGGAREFSYWPNEEIELGAAIVNYGNCKQAVDIKITLTEMDSKRVVYSEINSLEVQSGKSLKKLFGSLKAKVNSGGYKICTELIFNHEVIDVIEYEIGMLSTKNEPKSEFVSTKATKFKLRGKDWYPVGANYWPRNAIATEQIDYLYHWLTPGYYDPEQVDEDLQSLNNMNGNFIAIRADYVNNRRTLLDFMRRCRKYDIYVYLLLQTHKVTVEPHYFEGIMMPFNFQEAEFADFLEETKMANNPALMAWDLIWEPSNWLFQDNITMFGWDGDSNFRNRFDSDWENWINERYGNLANAETDWKYKVPRTPNGKITSPQSKQFEKDGPWRIMIAAYRRFTNDLSDRQYNNTCQKIRELDPNHLISYRQGNLPPNDYTLTSTLKHVDFFSMEGYSFPPNEYGQKKVGFVNRYLTHMLPDKPFMWNEYGYGGPWGLYTRHLDGEDLRYQSEYVEMIHTEAYKNGANGIAPWWFAGGLRASEKTDFGITTPEGTLRPSGESLKKYGEMYLKHPPKRPKPNTWINIDTDKHSGGLWHITNTFGADAYEQATKQGKCLGIKTSATGTNSSNTPLVAVGNTNYNGNNPPKFLNAEFNWFKIKVGENNWVNIKSGETIKVPKNTIIKAVASVGNLQEATWLSPDNCKKKPGAVYLSSVKKTELDFKLAIDKNTKRYKDTDFGGEFILTNGISKETKVVLRMTAINRAWFGEKIEFVLVPANK